MLHRRTRRGAPRRSRDPRVTILFTGYSAPTVAGTVGLIQDGTRRIIIDPGMVPRRAAILGPLRRAGLEPTQITDVVFSHHHPDHTLNAALFPRARFHDVWAIYRNDVWESRPAEGYRPSPHVRLIETPGHTPQDITTLVELPNGTTAFTHLWWDSTGPSEDPLAENPALLHRNRRRVARLAHRIVPGHGAPFERSPTTPL
ncbi:MAG TPA: MBL fold metallo-hydrolase [Thermoplasmata archaeon]|nr:MBL fold metallo-hydrolase [Thermoplasmata archaeon]